MEPRLHYLVMADDYKKRVENAIYSYYERQQPKKVTPRKKNEKPEAEFMLLFKKYLEGLGWSVDIIESKGVFNEEAGRYMHGKTRPGYPDISGNMCNGLAIYIETKAPGRRSTVRPDQREFLINKIASNCFAIVCDSINYFDRVFAEWQESPNKKAFLLKEIPELSGKYKDDDEPLF